MLLRDLIVWSLLLSQIYFQVHTVPLYPLILNVTPFSVLNGPTKGFCQVFSQTGTLTRKVFHLQSPPLGNLMGHHSNSHVWDQLPTIPLGQIPISIFLCPFEQSPIGLSTITTILCFYLSLMLEIKSQKIDACSVYSREGEITLINLHILINFGKRLP